MYFFVLLEHSKKSKKTTSDVSKDELEVETDTAANETESPTKLFSGLLINQWCKNI